MFRQTALQQLPEFFCFRQKGVKRPFYPLSGRHHSLNPGGGAGPVKHYGVRRHHHPWPKGTGQT